MPLPVYIVDAFADEPFTGNPAGVVVLEAPGDPVWMQRVAMELKHSETAFVLPMAREGVAADEGWWSIRYFTPAVEVPLCGHATLASAHVLWESGRVAEDQTVEFVTIEDVRLRCARGDDGRITMTFPADVPAEAEAPTALLDALGVDPVCTARSRFDWILELEDAAAVERVSPDFVALYQLDVRGVAVTARDDTGNADFVSRFFAPGSGIDEDPVTGSLHAALGPYWAARLNKSELRAHQVSQRGGRLLVTARGDQVEIAGKARTVIEGALLLA